MKQPSIDHLLSFQLNSLEEKKKKAVNLRM